MNESGAVYIFAFCVAWGLGLIAGRVTAQFHRDTEAVERALGVHGHTDSDANPDAVSVNNGPGWYLNQRRDARRRTILRDHSGPRAGRHAAGSDPDRTDAAAVK